MDSPRPGWCFNARTASPEIPAHELGVPVDPVQGLDTTYFFAASIVRPNGAIQSGMTGARSDGRQADSIISYVTRPKSNASARSSVFDRVTMRLLVRGDLPVVAAPVQRDVDRVPKRPHHPNLLTVSAAVKAATSS